MTQYGFFFDQSRCSGCGACVVACKDWYDLPPGPVKWMRLYQWETGAWPNVRVYELAIPCYHCQNPVCVDAAGGAMLKEEKYGAVLIDPLKASSPGMRKAANACPYGAIVFESDATDAKASLCTMCIDRLEQGLKPICVMSCPQRAFDFDTLDNLQAKYGTSSDLDGLPSSTEAKPAVVFKPALPKKQLVPYDANQALLINAKRPVGPALYNSATDVTDIPAGLISRNKPVLKTTTTKDLMHYTADNES